MDYDVGNTYSYDDEWYVSQLKEIGQWIIGISSQ